MKSIADRFRNTAIEGEANLWLDLTVKHGLEIHLKIWDGLGERVCSQIWEDARFPIWDSLLKSGER